jgi:hypothetical protein
MPRGGDNSLLIRIARGCALLLLLTVACTARAAPSPQEYISGFVLYVRWPEDEQIRAWQVCVASPVTAADPYFATLQVRDRPFAVRHIRAGEPLDGCQILDLTSAEPATAVALLKATQTRRSLLTVGNGRDFCSAGGMICLLQDQPRGGFEVNLSAIRGAGFNINARLLMMARQTETAGAP